MTTEGAKEAVHAWQKGLYGDRWEGLLTGGAYPNCPSDTYGAEEAVQKYYGSNLCRLVKAKRAYDPDNLFAYEQGVPLSAATCDE